MLNGLTSSVDNARPGIRIPHSAIRNRTSGFTLIELMAALFVLTFGMFGVVQMYDFGLDKILMLRESATATRLVRNEIEMLRGRPFAELTDRENAPFAGPTPGLEDLVNGTPAVTIRPYGDPGLGLKEVTVSLRWTGDNARTMERTTTTLIADKAGGALPPTPETEAP